MPAYLETWDVTTPAGSEDKSLGDDRIREHKRAVTERLSTDHHIETDETGNQKIGYHKKVTLPAQAADPNVVAGAGIFYSKDVGGGIIEAFYEDPNGRIAQLTNLGSVKSLSKEVRMWFGAISELPTGWYLCDGTGGRPDLRDKFVVGARQDSAGVAMTNVEGSLAQSAAPTHTHGGGNTGATTLTTAQIPSHTHGIHNSAGGGGGGGDLTNLQKTDNANLGGISTDAAGGGTSHDHTIAAQAAIPTYYALAYISQYNV